jgi:hypothetical protein
MKLQAIAVYLAGNIKKNHEQESEIMWTTRDEQIIVDALSPSEVIFLNPASRADDLSDQKSVFGRDMSQVFIADLVFVDARKRRGLGVGAEMMWAKMNHIPVIIVAPFNSHYRRDEVTLLGKNVQQWVHPFIESLSDLIIEDLNEEAHQIHGLIHGELRVKGPEFISEAMHYYQNTQLVNDLPMLELMETHPYLKAKMRNRRFCPESQLM